jgi:hypothetical protein
MKKLFLAVILLMVLSIGFSDAITDFVKNNLNFVIAAFTFVLIFGISMGTAGIWVENSGQITLISLGISILIAVLVMLNPNLATIIASIIQYSPIFLVIFIIAFLIIVVLFTNRRSHPWIKGLAAAILIAVIIGIIYLNQSEGVISESSSNVNFGSTGIVITFIIIAGIVGVVAYLIKRKSSEDNISPSLVKGLEKKARIVPSNSDNTIIKGKIVEYDRITLKWKSPKKSLKTDKLAYDIKIEYKEAGSIKELKIAESDKKGNFFANLKDLSLNYPLKELKVFFKVKGRKFSNNGEDEKGYELKEKEVLTLQIAYLPGVGAILKGKVQEYIDNKKIPYSRLDSGWQIKVLATDNTGKVITEDKSLSHVMKKEDISKSFYNGKFVMLLYNNLNYPLTDSIICATKNKQEFYSTDEFGKNPLGENKVFNIEDGKTYENIIIPFDLSMNNINLKVKEGNDLIEDAKVTLIDENGNDLDSSNSWGFKKTNKYGLCNFKVSKNYKEEVTFKVKSGITEKISDGVEVK